MTRDRLETRGVAEPGQHRWWMQPFEPAEADLILLAKLSQRERQVVEGLADGDTNAQIGARLGVSTKTVGTHRGNVLRKLRLRNNADLARFAIRVGLVGLGGAS